MDNNTVLGIFILTAMEGLIDITRNGCRFTFKLSEQTKYSLKRR